MKRIAVGVALLLMAATSAIGAGYTWKNLNPIAVGTTAVQLTRADKTFNPRIYLSPAFTTEEGVMFLGDSGVAIAHGIAITHTMAIHGNNLMLETGNFWEQWDLSNMWVICNESNCGLNVTFPAPE